ncbi:MAG: NUDIX hydrolase [Coriobacteriia bacterium]|nr:NUDIX hydrolase [Coriobacteriia bacterium]
MNLEEKQISTQRVYDGALLKVNKDQIELPNKNTTIREYFNHPGASCVVALTDDNKVVIERQFRYPFHSIITELPAGKLDKGEDPLVAAKRELKEETGYTAKRWTYMGDFYPSVAYTDENIRLYLAQDLTLEEQHLDDDEFVEVELIDFQELVNMVMQGKIKDGKSIAAILKADKIIS